jgi:hypothetical protein
VCGQAGGSDGDGCVIISQQVGSNDGHGAVGAHKHVLMEADMLRYCEKLDPDGDEQEQCEICGSLEHILRQDSQLKHSLILHHQVCRPRSSI